MMTLPGLTPAAARAGWAFCALLIVAGCRDRGADENAPAVPFQLPILDIAALPTPLSASSAGRDAEKNVLFLAADGRVPFHRAQAQFLAHLDAAEARFSVSFMDAQGDSALQSSQLAGLQSDPPSAILIQPLDLASMLQALADLHARGVTIVLVDALDRLPPSAPDALFEVYSDPREIGRQAAALAVNALSQRAIDRGESAVSGRVLQIRGSDSSAWCGRVHDGFLEGLDAHPGIVLVHDAPADWNPEAAKWRYADALRLQKKIDVVFAHDDFLARAVHEAARESQTRDDMLVIGVNGFPGPEGGLQMLHRQEIDATVRRPWLVDDAWQILQDLADHPGLPPKSRQQSKPWLVRPKDLDQLDLDGRRDDQPP